MNIYLRVATKNWFTDPEIAHLPRRAQVASMTYGAAVTHSPPQLSKHWMPGQHYGLWQYLNKPDHHLIGFNLNHFDIPVIRNRIEAPADPVHTTFDLFAVIRDATKRWYSLTVLAGHNLQTSQTSNGSIMAGLLLRNQTIKVVEHLANDISAIRQLYEILVAEKPLLLPWMPDRDHNTNLYFWAFPEVRFEVASESEPYKTR